MKEGKGCLCIHIRGVSVYAYTHARMHIKNFHEFIVCTKAMTSPNINVTAHYLEVFLGFMFLFTLFPQFCEKLSELY